MMLDQQTNTSLSKSMFLCELRSTQNYRVDLVTTITCRCSGPSTSKSLSLPHSARTYNHHGDSVSASQDPNTLQSSSCGGLSAAVQQAASCMEVWETKRRSTDVPPYCTVRPSETWLWSSWTLSSTGYRSQSLGKGTELTVAERLLAEVAWSTHGQTTGWEQRRRNPPWHHEVNSQQLMTSQVL